MLWGDAFLTYQHEAFPKQSDLGHYCLIFSRMVSSGSMKFPEDMICI